MLAVIKKLRQGTMNFVYLMLDQIRAIDNKRLIKKVGDLSTDLIDKVKENILIILDLAD